MQRIFSICGKIVIGAIALLLLFSISAYIGYSKNISSPQSSGVLGADEATSKTVDQKSD